MKKQSKSLFALTSTNFQALEDHLIQKNKQAYFDKQIKQVQQIFLQNKVLDQIYREEHQRTLISKDNIKKAQKRISQIKQLNRVIDRQTSLMKTQAQKINDAMTLNKILMMEKLLRLQRQADDLNKKKQICNKVRTQKLLWMQNIKEKNNQKLQRVKLQSLNTTLNVRQQLQQIRCNTMQMKRRQADQIRLDHQRQKTKSKKIQSFKEQRAKNNYLSKILQIKDEIDNKQEKLFQISKAQKYEQRKVEATQQIAHQYLNSFFTTQNTTL